MRSSVMGIPVIGTVNSETGTVTYWHRTRSRRCDFCGNGLGSVKGAEVVRDGRRYTVHVKKCLPKMGF